jgi:RNA polymerase sigma factor (sigma-70 family)
VDAQPKSDPLETSREGPRPETRERSFYEPGYAIPIALVEHVRRAQEDENRGDDRATDILIGRVYRVVHRVVRYRLSALPDPRSAADDVTHDALVRVSIAIGQCRAKTDKQAWAWIWTVVESARLDYLRRELPSLYHEAFRESYTRTLFAASSIGAYGSDDNYPTAGDELLLQCVMEVYEAMPEQTMELFRDRLVLSSSYEELARKFGTSPGGAKRRLQRATIAIRRGVVQLIGRMLAAGDERAKDVRAAIDARRGRSS